MSKKVVVIGGGIIGLCSAYFLNAEGCEVTIIDKSDIASGASFVNAGYIAPSHIIPLASPGIITKGLKWMFDSSSPFYVKPRLNSDFLKWAWAFKKSAKKEKVERAIPVIKDINLLSRELFKMFASSPDFHFHHGHKGLLMAYQTDEAGAEEWEVGQRAIKEGLEVENLSKKELEMLDPTSGIKAKGAVYYKCDAHTTPSEFMEQMLVYLKQNGVVFYTNEAVKDIEVEGGKIKSILTDKQSITADEFVLAAGSWSPKVTRKLGVKIPIEAGKGYRIDVQRKTGITIPTILIESKVAVTPMNGFTRFAGTMEIGGINHEINPVRVDSIASAAEQFYSNIKITDTEKSMAACGLRPVSPDGLPYIGKSKKCSNLTIATGHAMMGWSLGPATGKLVSEVILSKKTSMNLAPFNPDRKF